jgi:hypothetical protein
VARIDIVHWEGRAALAAIHGPHDAVAADVLPPPAELTAVLNRHGFMIVACVDNEREIYLEAGHG